MKRGIIDPSRIQEHSLDNEYSKSKDEEFYYNTIKVIKEAIDDIFEAGKKITYARIAQRLQLQFTGITATELHQNYLEEITAYTSQYD